MSSQQPSDTRPWSTVLARAIVPSGQRPHRQLCYLLLMFPLGVVYFNLLAVGFATGIGLAVVGVGLPILVVTLVIATGAAALERRFVGTLLDVRVAAPAVEPTSGVWERTVQLATDGRTWKGVAYLLSVFVFGSLAFGLLGALVATAWSFLTAPLYYRDAAVVAYGPVPRGDFALDVLFGWDDLLVGLTTTFRLGSWRLETLPEALLVAGLGVVLLLVAVRLISALATIWGRYARTMLAVPNYWRFSER